MSTTDRRNTNNQGSNGNSGRTSRSGRSGESGRKLPEIEFYEDDLIDTSFGEDETKNSSGSALTGKHSGYDDYNDHNDHNDYNDDEIDIYDDSFQDEEYDGIRKTKIRNMKLR